MCAQFSFGVEEDGFVYKVLAEEASVEVSAAFEEETQDVAFGQKFENVVEAEMAILFGNGLDFCPGFAEHLNFLLRGSGAGEDEEVVFRCADQLGIERNTKVGVQNDAEERSAAGLTGGAKNAAAVG